MSICAFCFSKTIRKKYSVHSTVTSVDVEYTKCKKCGSVQQTTLVSEDILSKYYENYYSIKQNMNPGYLNKNQYLTLKKERLMTFNEIGFPIESIKNSVNIELGCANGHFIQFLKEFESSKTIGIDISEDLLSSINIPDVKLINGSLADISDNTCDNLYLFNILEHLPDIEKAMTNVLRITKENSSIIVELPIAGFIQTLFGRKWRFLMPDEHIFIPSIKGFSILLDRFGLEIKGKTRFGSGFTTGMIPNSLKRIIDKSAKYFSFGDRGTFLIKRKGCK